MKVMLSEVRQTIREELYRMIDEIVSNQVPPGTAWKLSGGKAHGAGWGAKNKNGVSNYWYSDDEEANKQKANQFKDDTDMKPEPKKEK